MDHIFFDTKLPSYLEVCESLMDLRINLNYLLETGLIKIGLDYELKLREDLNHATDLIHKTGIWIKTDRGYTKK